LFELSCIAAVGLLSPRTFNRLNNYVTLTHSFAIKSIFKCLSMHWLWSTIRCITACQLNSLLPCSLKTFLVCWERKPIVILLKLIWLICTLNTDRLFELSCIAAVGLLSPWTFNRLNNYVTLTHSFAIKSLCCSDPLFCNSINF